MNPRKFVMAKYEQLKLRFENDGKSQRELIAFVVFISCVAVVVSSLAVFFILNFKQAIVYIHEPFDHEKPVIVYVTPSPSASPSPTKGAREPKTSVIVIPEAPHVPSFSEHVPQKSTPKPSNKATKKPEPKKTPSTAPQPVSPPKNPTPAPTQAPTPNLVKDICNGVLNPVLGVVGTKCSDLGLN